jgi:hypothetical protein
LFPLTKTLDGSDRALSLPLKIQTFSNNTVLGALWPTAIGVTTQLIPIPQIANVIFLSPMMLFHDR